MGFRNKIMKEHENIVLCGYPVQFLLILENFCINRKLNLKKVSLYKPPLTPFWPCPAKQQGIFLSFHLRGKTNRQMLCIKGGRKGDKNWRKHVRARYLSTDHQKVQNCYFWPYLMEACCCVCWRLRRVRWWSWPRFGRHCCEGSWHPSLTGRRPELQMKTPRPAGAGIRWKSHRLGGSKFQT